MAKLRSILLVIIMCCWCYDDGFAETVIVSKDGRGDYTSIREAINQAPSFIGKEKKHRIYVAAGVYEEYIVIPREKTNIVLIGSGRKNTKIVGDRSASDTTVDQTATLVVDGTGFVAQNMGILNIAGSTSGPGVAVLNKATNTAFYKCSIEGHQDTLWALSGRQFYRDCDIYGTVDFIMGDAAALFQRCNLFARVKDFVTFTAQSRGSATDPTGFVFQFCRFSLSPEESGRRSEIKRATLGRPWREYARVVIMESYLESLIDPMGWEVYDSSVPTDKVSYIEYGNKGDGAKTSGRVKWPGVTLVYESQEVVPFTASNFIGADDWLPVTSIPYHPGL